MRPYLKLSGCSSGSTKNRSYGPNENSRGSTKNLYFEHAKSSRVCSMKLSGRLNTNNALNGSWKSRCEEHRTVRKENAWRACSVRSTAPQGNR
jgi:hypothetical protein